MKIKKKKKPKTKAKPKHKYDVERLCNKDVVRVAHVEDRKTYISLLTFIPTTYFIGFFIMMELFFLFLPKCGPFKKIYKFMT